MKSIEFNGQILYYKIPGGDNGDYHFSPTKFYIKTNRTGFFSFFFPYSFQYIFRIQENIESTFHRKDDLRESIERGLDFHKRKTEIAEGKIL